MGEQERRYDMNYQHWLNDSLISFPLPQLSYSSHSPTASLVSSSPSTNFYSNPYATRKDKEQARKIQLRSFKNTYRTPLPPVMPVEPERWTWS